VDSTNWIVVLAFINPPLDAGGGAWILKMADQDLFELLEKLIRLEDSWSEDGYRPTKITGRARNIISFCLNLLQSM
jgi:hypothetical protein